MEKAKVIAITGGPGGGKSTCFENLQKKLTALGVRPFFAPECATMLIGGGIPDISEIAGNDIKKYIEIERQMLRTQLALRKQFLDMSDVFEDERRVALCDRGAKDVEVYLPPGVFEAILEDERLTLWDVRDSYDAVIFLRSAASGAEKFYTTANNPNRREKDPKEARCLDELTLKAWIGHQRLWIIPSRENFEEKLEHAFRAILHTLKTPSIEIERKFLLKAKPNFRKKALGDAVKLSMEQIYLVSAGKSTERIRKMTQGSYSVCYFTRKTNFPGSKVSREECEERIGALDYLYLSEHKDPATKIIKKDRYYFVWKDQYFALDIFREPKKLAMLEIELLDEKDKFDLPAFLDIDREVTGDPNFINHAIARS